MYSILYYYSDWKETFFKMSSLIYLGPEPMFPRAYPQKVRKKLSKYYNKDNTPKEIKTI